MREVENTAAEKGFSLRDRVMEPAEKFLEYRIVSMGRECSAEFRFSPSGGKLFAVVLTWDEEGFGRTVLENLNRDLGAPRQVVPGLEVYVWDREDSEVELRIWDEETILIFGKMTLWKQAREERRKAEKAAED